MNFTKRLFITSFYISCVLGTFACKGPGPSESDLAQFYIDKLQALPLNAGEQPFLAGPQTLKVYFEFCVFDKFGARIDLDREPFQVTLSSVKQSDAVRLIQPSHLVKLQSNHCAYFEQEMEVLSLPSETWQAFDLRVKSAGNHYQNQIVRRQLYLNFSNPQNFLFDGIQGKPPRLAGQDQNQVTDTASLKLRNVHYALQDTELAVGDYLNLRIRKKYSLKLEVLVDSGRSINGSEFSLENSERYWIPESGRYRLRAYLAAPAQRLSEIADSEIGINEIQQVFLASDERYGSQDRTVELVKGEIRTDLLLDFQFQQLPLLGGRNRLYLILEAVNPSSALRAATISIPFYSGINGVGEAWGLDQPAVQQSNLAIIHTLSEHAKEMKNLNDAEFDVKKYQDQIEKAYSFKKASVLALQRSGWDGPTAIRYFSGELDEDEQVIKICALLYAPITQRAVAINKSSDYDLCRRRPMEFYRLQPLRLVEKVKNYRLEDDGYNLLQVQANILKEWREGNVTTTGGRGFTRAYGYVEKSSLPLARITGWGNGVRGEIGVEGFVMHDFTTGFNIRNRRVVSNFKNFDVDYYQFSVEALSHPCLIIEMLRSTRDKIFICDPRPFNTQQYGWISETWYYLQQNMGERGSSSVFRDLQKTQYANYALAIRGDEQFNALRDVLEDSARTIYLDIDDSLSVTETEISRDFKKYLSGLNSTTQSQLPGLHI